jgi:hypothetical protein
MAAEGSKSDKVKLFKGVDGGVFEIAIKRRGDAFRVSLCREDRRGYLGDSCLSEEIQVRNQDTSDGG